MELFSVRSGWWKVKGALPKWGGVTRIYSIKAYESRDQHMLRRLWAGCALEGLGNVTAHDLIF